MGTHSHHLTMEDRCDLARLHAAGLSLRHIAATLDRPPSTVAREMTRNRSRTQGYQPGYAEQQARARRWRGARLARDAPSAPRASPTSNRGGPPSRGPGASPATPDGRFFPTKPSLASSTPRSLERKPMPDGTISLTPKPPAAAGANAAAPPQPPTARPRATGKLI